MKILALTKYFPPEIGTSSHLFFELCETLVQLGHQVSVITSIPWYNLEEVEARYKKHFFLKENIDGINVIRIANPPLPEGSIKLKAGHLLVPPMFGLGLLTEDRHDVVIAYSPPLLMGLTAYLYSKAWQAPFIFNAQDLYPQCIIDLGQLRNRSLIWAFERLEAFIYQKAAFITVHSEGNRDFLTTCKGVDASKVRVAHNWVDTDFIHPGPKANPFAGEHQLGDKFVVSFAGTMGISQGIVSVVEAAQYLKDYPDILLLLVGGGIDKDRAVQRSRELGLDNIKFLPMQPREVYPRILDSSDICLVTLRKDIKTPVVPSKILSIMAAGRPVLASMPLEGDAPALIHRAQAGLCVEPENPQALAAGILQIYQESAAGKLMGSNGRRYAEEHFSRQACVAAYEGIFQEALERDRLARRQTNLCRPNLGCANLEKPGQGF
jgi:colanic acid biosynthesis glycosyl transferase WcaI